MIRANAYTRDMIVWTSDLSVGVVEIDDQHKELFARINRLFGAIDANVAEAELRKLFLFLESYVVEHFGNEERYMDDFAMHIYPDTEHHKSEHKAFIRDLNEYKNDLAAADPSAQFIEEFKKWMRNWWMIHIQSIDKGLGKSLQAAFPLLSHPSKH